MNSRTRMNNPRHISWNVSFTNKSRATHFIFVSNPDMLNTVAFVNGDMSALK